MKTLLVLFSLLFALSSWALDRKQAERLLQSRQLSLRQFELLGSQLLLGEVTGAGLVVPASRVEVVLLNDKVILKKEIESMDFIPVTGKLGDLDSFRAGGTYFTKADIRGLVIR